MSAVIATQPFGSESQPDFGIQPRSGFRRYRSRAQRAVLGVVLRYADLSSHREPHFRTYIRQRTPFSAVIARLTVLSIAGRRRACNQVELSNQLQ